METHAILQLLSLTTIGISGALIVTGVALILTGHEELHKRAMLTASLFAIVFVVLYVIKSALYEPAKYAGDHRTLYFTILWSHTVLAALNLPLAIYTVYLALKGLEDRHRRIAPVTASVWLYVAVTGWTIYFFLH